jgi:ribose transport system substrate-binding protein
MPVKLCALVLAAVCLSACGDTASDSDGGAAAGDSKPRIAVIPKGTTHVFWQSVKAGAFAARDELGIHVEFKGPTKEDDRNSQISLLERMVTSRKFDGILLAPLDDTALVSPVEHAVEKNLPVVIFDSALNSDRIVSFVATDNYRGGRMAGDRLGELLGRGKRVAMLRYQQNSASTDQRELGFVDAVKAHGLVLVSEDVYGGATRETAQKASENLLRGLDAKGGADGIFCPNESTTYGMLIALREKGLNGKIRFVGFDSAPTLLDGLRRRDVDALVVQNPYRMGYLGVKTLVAHLKGEPVEKRIDTGVSLVTLDNLESPAIREVLNPAGK